MVLKKSNEDRVIRLIVKFLIPFILMYGLYIQWNGEYSAGGGFQAGVICAVAFIVYGLVYGLDVLSTILPFVIVRFLASLGVLIYACVGGVTLLLGGNFLDYNVLLQDPVAGQKLGIILIEVGVGITVFAVMVLIYYVFSNRLTDDKK